MATTCLRPPAGNGARKRLPEEAGPRKPTTSDRSRQQVAAIRGRQTGPTDTPVRSERRVVTRSGRRALLAVGSQPAVDQRDAAVDLGMAEPFLAGDELNQLVGALDERHAVVQ